MSLRRPVLAALLALAAVPASAPAAPSNRVVVDAASRGGGCTDAQPASQATARRPFCSIARALEAATEGGTVVVREGSYPPVVATGMAPARRVTLTARRGEEPVVAGLEVEHAEDLRITGLTFTATVVVRNSTDVQVDRNDFRLAPAGAQTPSGVVLDEVQRVVVHGNRVTDGRDGVNVLGTVPPSTDLTITGNHFERLGNDGVHLSRGERILVAGNTFTDVAKRDDIDPSAHADGMQVMGPTQSVTITGNRFSGGRGILAMVTPRSVDLPGQGHQGLVISNNVFLGPDFGIRSFSTPGARIVNNTIWGQSTSTYSGLDVRDRQGTANDRSTGVVLANNVVKVLHVDPAVEPGAWTANLVASGTRGPADLAGTPSFADLAAGDARLARGSAGVDAAAPAHAPKVDIEGRSRSARPDTGAYELPGAVTAGIATVSGRRAAQRTTKRARHHRHTRRKEGRRGCCRARNGSTHGRGRGRSKS